MWREINAFWGKAYLKGLPIGLSGILNNGFRDVVPLPR